MNTPRPYVRIAALFLSLGICLEAAPAIAQDASQQVLDRVFTYSSNAVLNLAFSNVVPGAEVNNLELSASLITTCTLTTVDGLWCLDGRDLRRWPNPLDPTVRVTEFSCADPALGFDTLVPTVCTGMTVDKAGVIWLSGKKKLPSNWPNRPWWISEQTWMALQTWFNPYSVVKVTRKKAVEVCPIGAQELAGKLYCGKEAFTGKFLVTRLSPVDGDAAKTFRPCPNCQPQSGVLGVEDFRNVVFFPANPAGPAAIPVTGGWNAGLKFGEVLDDVSFLVFNGQSNVLAMTSFGRVLAKNTATGGTALQVFNVPLERAPGSVKCSIAPTQFAIRSAASSSVVFVSDRQYCQVSALAPNASFTALVNLTKVGGGDLTLLTKDGANFPIFGLTVAPGVGIDFRNCGPNGAVTQQSCAIVSKAGGAAAAELENVKLQPGNSFGATVFQMKNIPDCRYAAESTFLTAQRALCASLSPGVVVNPDGTLPTINPVTGVSNSTFPPAAQLLNVRPLLPSDVTSAFDNSGVPPTGLPVLLISRQYRGQKDNKFQFGALFINTGGGVKYKGVLGAEYDVPALQGKLPPTQPDVRCVPTSNQLANLLAWDVTTAVSETYVSIGGKYIDSLANVGCGSIKGSYGRLSLLPYDLEISPDTYAPTALSPFTSKLTTGNDAVYARLVDSLVNDLGYVFKELACKPADPTPHVGPAPLPASVCGPNSNANTQLYWLRWKLDRCLVGSFVSKNVDAALPPSLQNRPYCQLFLGRLNEVQAALPNRDSTDPTNDVANRLGELHARIDILRHVYSTRFLPSIPDRGFCKELNSCSYNSY